MSEAYVARILPVSKNDVLPFDVANEPPTFATNGEGMVCCFFSGTFDPKKRIDFVADCELQFSVPCHDENDVQRSLRHRHHERGRVFVFFFISLTCYDLVSDRLCGFKQHL